MLAGSFKEYMDVVGSVEHEDETETWHGRLLTIKDRPIDALVTYEAESLLELQQAFHEAVKEYYRIGGE